MSLVDLFRPMLKKAGNRAASARYRARNPELCRARVRASKLKAKRRAGA